jgi:cell division protein FtsB
MKTAKHILDKILPILKNKYVLSLLVFLVWLTFFDQNNLIDRVKQLNRNEKLKKEKAFYIEKIKEDSTKLHQLKTNEENLEEFAREQYYMKKKDEDIYIIVEE